jgi:hypothetical protein
MGEARRPSTDRMITVFPDGYADSVAGLGRLLRGRRRPEDREPLCSPGT